MRYGINWSFLCGQIGANNQNVFPSPFGGVSSTQKHGILTLFGKHMLFPMLCCQKPQSANKFHGNPFPATAKYKIGKIGNVILTIE